MKLRKRSEAIANGGSRNVSAPESAPNMNGAAETSAELRDALRESEKEAEDKRDEERRKHFKFPVGQRTTGERELREDLRQIVETHWVEDMTATWNRIRVMLKVGEKRSQHGHLHRALDDARELAQEAHGLAVTAKLEAQRWELVNEVVHAAMWKDALAACEQERREGHRSKNITDTDVRSKCMTLFPDQYAAQEHERHKVKLTVERMDRLAKDASEKVEDLRVMLSKLRG